MRKYEKIKNFSCPALIGIVECGAPLNAQFRMTGSPSHRSNDQTQIDNGSGGSTRRCETVTCK